MSFTNSVLRMPMALRGRSRMAFVAIGVLVFVVLVAAVFLIGRSAPQTSQVNRTPSLSDLPGDAATDLHLKALALEDAQRRAQEAAKQKQSYVASIRGADTTVTALPPPVSPTQSAPTASGYTSNPFFESTGTPSTPTASTGNNMDRADVAYAAMFNVLLAGMAPKAAAMSIEESQEMLSKKHEEQRKASEAMATSQRAGSGGGAQGSHGAILMPALRWAMAKTVVATDTDGEGGQVIVEITSGPLKDARLYGKAQRRNELMGVSLTDLIWHGKPISVDAVLMSPETKEMAVASGVDHHYAARLLYPSLAAMASGAGQAVALSGSQQTNSVYGSSSTFKNLNPTQIGLVGLGAAGNNLQQVLNDMAPKGPTVRLDADVPVGVMFLKDVVDTP